MERSTNLAVGAHAATAKFLKSMLLLRFALGDFLAYCAHGTCYRRLSSYAFSQGHLLVAVSVRRMGCRYWQYGLHMSPRVVVFAV